jgi:tetratricopeptide (TPR) repeat protein
LLRATGTEAIADLELALGQSAQARTRYLEIAKQEVDEDRLRALEVKADASQPLAREAIVALLIGDPRLGRDFSIAAARLARWSSERPDEGEPDYLLGKNFYQQGRYEEAAARLDRALGRTIRLPRLRSEALRTRITVACALADLPTAKRLLGQWQAEPGSRPAQRQAMARFAEHCGIL